VVALAASLVVLALPVAVTNAGASEARVDVAGLAATPTHDAIVHRTITTTFDLALASAHARALSSFLTSLDDTASTQYHHFLTPAAFARRFGATPATVAAVRAYLRSFGLRVGSLSAGHDVLHVRGTTTAIADAFDAPVEVIRLSDGTLDAHFTSPGTLPSALARDVTGVAGLSAVAPASTNLVVDHASRAVAAAGTCPSAGSATSTTPNTLGGYTVQQQGDLYGLTNEWAAGNTGVGQTLGVYELATYGSSDVATYLSCYDVQENITSIDVDGGPTAADNAGDASDEATLDVEEAQVLAPGAKVEVYQGTQSGSGPTDVYTQIASDDTASVVTTSWGICEAQTDGSAQVEQTIFEEMAAQGQTMVAAAGDEGSSDCEDTSQPSTTPAVDDPASQPFVTGVGGLTVSSIGPLSESVWNDECTRNDCGAGGGGVSSLWTQPSWQVAPGITTTAATGGMRMVPDVSTMADPSTGFIQYYTGDQGSCRQRCPSGWDAIGGTSIGAPLVGAMVVIAAQACDTPGGRLGFINPSLYAMASTGFVDVTAGSNDLFGVGKYSAGAGYDMASGLGSPDGAAFLDGLCPPPVSATTSSFVLSSASASIYGAAPSVTATLRNASGAALSDVSVQVSATGTAGTVLVDGDTTSATGTGTAAEKVATSTAGVATFSVTSTVAQTVEVSVTYAGSTIYTTSIAFDATAAPPGPPTIVRLAPLVGGFELTLRAPSITGGDPIISYEYSINGGATWVRIAGGARSVDVTALKKGAAYRVSARDRNAVGPSSAAPGRRVVTRS
jgi:subtilase family serine protease